MTQLDPQFAASTRAHLVDTALGKTPLAARSRRLRIGIGFGAGLGVVSLLTAGALVVAAAFVPGEHLITPADGDAISVTGSGTTTVELGARPDDANAVGFVLTCTSAGTFELETGPGEGAFMECADVADYTTVDDERHLAPIGKTMTIADLPLAPGATSFVLTASEGAEWTIDGRYVTTVTTEWGVNANGQTFGTPNEKGSPDLIAAQATNGKIGYILGSDIWSGSSRIPVYEEDGTTVIGEFPNG